jgi:hypothetical protein
MKLDMTATKEDIEMFLLHHIDNADGRKSKNNPSLTKEQIWNIHMDVVVKGNFTRIKNLIVNQLVKEFGDYYEEG